jgi:monovalent cation/hydrogen antiporter
MSFFETLLALLALAIVLLQISRRLAVPYPTMLAAAGVVLALVPGTPAIALDPHIALALFIAPALVDAAFDFPLAAAQRFWRPLFSLAVIAVLLTTAAVAGISIALAGIPLYAAIALGAIVAPPDAAAATAILRTVRMPRRSVIVLKGESLLNDATSLLLFTGAVAFHHHDLSASELALRLSLAAPGGLLLGIGLAALVRRLMPLVAGTLGGTLLEFVSTFGAWIIAERLGLSAVLCLVAFGMSFARTANVTTPPRVRIHSFAVWDTAVFLLNVLAFVLMGLQAKSIIGEMAPDRLQEAALLAAAVVFTTIIVRSGWLLAYNRLAFRFAWLRGPGVDPAPFRHGILIGWSGMRGLVTLATAFALPADFPQRDMLVLSAFAVVLATLVVQGLTLSHVVKWLGLDGDDGLEAELADAREDMANVALTALGGRDGPIVSHWRVALETSRKAAAEGLHDDLVEHREVGLVAIRAQRNRLDELRSSGSIGSDAYLVLQEELDFAEVVHATEAERRMEEG